MRTIVTDLTATTQHKSIVGLKAVGVKVADYLQLIKLKLSALVLFTVALGYLLALRNSLSLVIGHWLFTLLGSFLVIAAANAFNQVWEREVDGRMRRTMNRPLPAERMSVKEALCAAILMALVGLTTLALTTNWLTTFLAGLALGLYVLAYTPLKRRTEFCTLVGAIAGALPPVMGWTAVRGEMNLEAVALFALQFLWQFPHFWAIAWLYRDDYQRAGFRMLPVCGAVETVTRQVFGYAVATVLVSLYPLLMRLKMPEVYLTVAVLAGAWLLWTALQFGDNPTRFMARRLLITADAYLPLVLLAWLFAR
jgi:protoheme IX farnesyltransferase